MLCMRIRKVFDIPYILRMLSTVYASLRLCMCVCNVSWWILTNWRKYALVNLPSLVHSVPSYYLNQCWNIVNSNLRNIFQWNLNPNSYIYKQENAFENFIWKMASILSRPQCVNNVIHAHQIPWKFHENLPIKPNQKETKLYFLEYYVEVG